MTEHNCGREAHPNKQSILQSPLRRRFLEEFRLKCCFRDVGEVLEGGGARAPPHDDGTKAHVPFIPGANTHMISTSDEASIHPPRFSRSASIPRWSLGYLSLLLLAC